MTVRDLEAVKRELAEISSFVRDRVNPVAGDEKERLATAVAGMAQRSKDAERRSLLSSDGIERRVVDGGPYTGFDAFDLAIVRSLQKAAQAFSGSPRVDDLYGAFCGVPYHVRFKFENTASVPLCSGAFPR